jgi:mannose-6-phosphate isomerase-like protein (cupin superfamily)
MPDETKDQLIAHPEQPLAGTAITEMTQRERWNKKNPPVEAVIVKDLRTTELVAREYRGTKARFYRLSGAIRLQPHLSELPPGKASVNHRHTTEAVLYIVRGKGHTMMGYDGEELQRVDWEEGDLVGIPLWAWQDTFTVKQMGLHQIERHPDSPAGEE